nr:MAG TPA: hypothetical protein [Caudoviricetes sp.]
MGKKFNELVELRDRSRQLMDENRRLHLALKVSEGSAQQLAWKNAELRNQVEKERRTRELLSDIARFDTEAIEAITTSVQEIIETLVQKKLDALRAYDEKAVAKCQEPHELVERERGRKC